MTVVMHRRKGQKLRVSEVTRNRLDERRGDWMKIDDFLAALSVATPSRETHRAYKSVMLRFESFLNSQGIPEIKAKRTTILDFIAHRQSNRGRTVREELAPATINRELSVISQYYRWLQCEQGDNICNPVALVARPKVRNVKVRAIDESILRRLDRGVNSVRDRAMILVLLYSGLRISELHVLNRNSISAIRHVRRDGTIDFFGVGEVIGKGGKGRQFIVGPVGMNALKKYLISSKSSNPSEPLFLSSRRTRLSCRSMEHILGKWCKRLGVPHLNPHRLRHSFATRNVNVGMSLTVLQELLGHGSLQATQRYFKVNSERILREFFAAMEYVPRLETASAIRTRVQHSDFSNVVVGRRRPTMK
jgi:site-specific recombinase XerD